MTQWKIELAYDGTAFHGWQVQPGRPTVQGTLAATLLKLTGETVLPQGSGRTDAGVHALGQIASFALEAPIPPENLLRSLNRGLPPSIRVLSALPVAPGFHARHSACGKAYEYRIFATTPNRPCLPFLAPFAWDCRWQLDLGSMQQAAAHLLGRHDFTSFAASDPDLTLRGGDGDGSKAGPNPCKTLHMSSIEREGDLLVYRVHGSGFLHHMVRNLVGTLAEVGRGALSADAIPAILEARSRATAGPTAPARGLFLMGVDYPESAPASSESAPASSESAQAFAIATSREASA